MIESVGLLILFLPFALLDWLTANPLNLIAACVATLTATWIWRTRNYGR